MEMRRALANLLQKDERGGLYPDVVGREKVVQWGYAERIGANRR